MIKGPSYNYIADIEPDEAVIEPETREHAVL